MVCAFSQFASFGVNFLHISVYLNTKSYLELFLLLWLFLQKVDVFPPSTSLKLNDFI